MTKNTLQIGDTIQYGEIEIGKYQLSIQYRINELRQKLVDGIITKDEKEELKLLTA